MKQIRFMRCFLVLVLWGGSGMSYRYLGRAIATMVCTVI